MFQKVTVVTVHDGCGRPTIVKMTLAYVYYIGAVHQDGYDVKYNGDAGRPALWIALNSWRFKSEIIHASIADAQPARNASNTSVKNISVQNSKAEFLTTVCPV